MQAAIDFLIGTYSRDLGGMPARGDGIYAASLDLRTGEITAPECVARSINPSYLAWGPDRCKLYAAREVFADDEPAVVCYRSSAPHLEEEQVVSLQGELPCHVAVDATARFLTSAQYGSGDVALFRLGEGGKILEPPQHIQHTGKGPNEQRQEGPHAHYAAVLADRKLLVAVDLGLDAVIGYRLDTATGTVDSSAVFCIKTEPGSGPRHLALLPGTGTIYVYCELSDDIVQLELTDAGCERVGMVSAFERTPDADPAGAAIRISPDSRHLYVSGRSQSQIACFAIDPETHSLDALATVDTGGISPRDFCITPDGSFLVAANQDSDNLASLHRDSKSGHISLTGHSASVGSPVCILF